MLRGARYSPPASEIAAPMQNTCAWSPSRISVSACGRDENMQHGTFVVIERLDREDQRFSVIVDDAAAVTPLDTVAGLTPARITEPWRAAASTSEDPQSDNATERQKVRAFETGQVRG
jgi:hypothetical protein